MDSLQNLLAIHASIAWRHRWYVLGVIWFVCVLGWFVVSRIPDQYEASARLHVDTDAVLVPLLRGLAVDTGTASQAELMQKTLLSRTNLKRLLAMSYPDVADGPESERERVSQRLAMAIKIVSVGQNLFTLTYRDTDPRTAYRVVRGATTIFVDNQADAARTDMDIAQRFLREQIASYETQLSEAEKRRADFRTRYLGLLPGEGNAPSRLQSARDNLAKLQSDVADTQLRLLAVEEQIKSIPQFLALDGGANVVGNGVVATPSPAKQQLNDAVRNLNALQLRFTDRHPDVIAAKKLIEMLRSSLPPDGPGANSHSISNPVYEQVRLQIVERRINLTSLQAKFATAQAEADRLEQLARDAPGVEAEYARIDRDYTILQKNYNELVSRLEQARIADAANEISDNKVRLVDAPQVPQLPVAPKRLLFISVVLGLGFAVGVAVIVLFAQIDRSFNTLQSLRRVGLPVLGSIVRIGGPRSFRSWFRPAWFVLATALLFVVYGGLLIRAGSLSLGV